MCVCTVLGSNQTTDKPNNGHDAQKIKMNKDEERESMMSKMIENNFKLVVFTMLKKNKLHRDTGV